MAKLAAIYPTHEKLGKDIGLSGATISTAINEGRCKKPTEMACQLLWERHHADATNNQILAVLRIDKETMDFITPMVAKFGGTITVIK